MVKKNKVVSIVYRLTNEKGEELDKAGKDDPFTYLHGASQIVPGLEKALETLAPGQKKVVTVPPTEGYGEVEPSLKMKLDKKEFPTDMPLEPGIQFQASVGEDEGLVFTVEKVDGDTVHVDGNHPLAGMTLHFDVEVVEVREATAEELSHGHVHGPGGHH